MLKDTVALTAAAVLFSASSALAGTATNNLNVTATVLDACTVDAGSLNFGAILPASGTSARVSGALNVTCTLDTSFAVGLGEGLHASGGQRRLRRGATSSFINYDLFKGVTGIDRFGDSVTAQRVGGLTGLGVSPNTVPVFGEIAAGQTAGPGAYSDVVQITVHY